MSANLYDLLNVDETASTDEIRAAWKAAIADLDPTERRFRAFNDAAGVLLDDDRRATYDAELAEARAAEEAADEVAVASGTADDEADPTGDEADPTDDEAVVAGSSPRVGAGSAGAGGPSTAALVAAAVAAVLAAALAVWVMTMPGARGADAPGEVAERGARQERAAVSAEGAAEKMVAPVLSYNHETMAADLERASAFMTETMAGKQASAWPELTKEAEAQKIVVEAQVAGTALTRIDPDGERATVVVYIDQYVAKDEGEPFVLKMWATLSLVKASGSEEQWLLDDLCTDARCG